MLTDFRQHSVNLCINVFCLILFPVPIDIEDQVSVDITLSSLCSLNDIFHCEHCLCCSLFYQRRRHIMHEILLKRYRSGKVIRRSNRQDASFRNNRSIWSGFYRIYIFEFTAFNVSRNIIIFFVIFYI